MAYSVNDGIRSIGERWTEKQDDKVWGRRYMCEHFFQITPFVKTMPE
jgi:hypothetical protein